MQATSVSRRRRIWLLVGGLVVVGLLIIGGIAWAAWSVIDNIGAPGPGATGSGPCGSGDSVNLQLSFADGHVVQACTRDRPACPNQTVTGTGNGQTTSASLFTLNNQLRSSSRRYIFFMRLDGALPAETAEQTLHLDPRVGFLPDMAGPAAPNTGPPTAAVLQITPRDPSEDGYTAVSGSLTVSSSHSVAQGRIEGSFSSNGPAVSPVRIAGTFACNH
jgi:hypothetical protein